MSRCSPSCRCSVGTGGAAAWLPPSPRSVYTGGSGKGVLPPSPSPDPPPSVFLGGSHQYIYPGPRQPLKDPIKGPHRPAFPSHGLCWGLPCQGSSRLTGGRSVLRAAPSATQITVVLPHSSRELLYLGTESGNVFVVQLPAFRTLEDRTISSDAVLQR